MLISVGQINQQSSPGMDSWSHQGFTRRGVLHLFGFEGLSRGKSIAPGRSPRSVRAVAASCRSNGVASTENPGISPSVLTDQPVECLPGCICSRPFAAVSDLALPENTLIGNNFDCLVQRPESFEYGLRADGYRISFLTQRLFWQTTIASRYHRLARFKAVCAASNEFSINPAASYASLRNRCTSGLNGAA